MRRRSSTDSQRTPLSLVYAYPLGSGLPWTQGPWLYPFASGATMKNSSLTRRVRGISSSVSRTSWIFSPTRLPIVLRRASGAIAFARSVIRMLGTLGTNTSPPCITSMHRITKRTPCSSVPREGIRRHKDSLGAEFRGAIEADRISRLVRADQQRLLHSSINGGVDDVLASKDISPNRFRSIEFSRQHMLKRSRVDHNFH